MLLPTTYFSSLLLLVLALICFSVWPDLFRRSETRWRFELFSLDFAFGAATFALLAAYTLGTFGPEMTFSDRMLVAGRTSSVYLIGAGMVFMLGNMLLLAGIRLVGMALAFLIAAGTAAILFSLLHVRSAQPAFLDTCVVLFFLSVAGGALATYRSFNAAHRSRATKGLILAALSGLALGGFQPVVRNAADREFGPGPYAIALMFSVGLLVGTPVFNFFFMNIKIVGSPIGFGHYFQGSKQAHLPGVVSGAMFALGLLALLLPLSAPDEAIPGFLAFVLTLAGSALVCVTLGIVKWKEPAARQKAKPWFFAAIGCFCVALAFLYFSISRFLPNP